MPLGGWEIPARFSALPQEYETLRSGAGLLDISHVTKLRVSGRDRRTWLHGQVTQEIKGLADGRAAYAAILTPQGRLVSDLRVYAVPDALWLVAPSATAAPVGEYLDRFLIMERAEIEDRSEAWAALRVIGPMAVSALASVLGEAVCELDPWEVSTEQYGGEELYAARVPQSGEEGFDLLVPAPQAPSLWGALCQGRRGFAVQSVGWEAINTRRVEAGEAWWGAELDETIVPLEARLDHAVSRNKGCYVGQEIIARIDARGHVNNLLAGFLVHGEALPEPGAELQVGEKKVGRVTSAVHSPALGRPIALGFLRREHHAPGTRVEVVSAAGPMELEVTTLPFIPHAYTTEGLAGRATPEPS